MRNDLDANIKQISNNEASDYELDLKIESTRQTCI